MSDIRPFDFSFQATGVVPSVASIDVVALYNPQDGRVAHMHHVITFIGAQRSSRENQERNALENARRLGCNVDDLRILHVPDFNAQGSMFQVDVEKQALVELEVATMRDEIRIGKPHQREERRKHPPQATE